MYKVKRFSGLTSTDDRRNNVRARNIGDSSATDVLISSALPIIPATMSGHKSLKLVSYTMPVYALAARKRLKGMNEEFDKAHPGKLSESEEYERQMPKKYVDSSIGYLAGLGGAVGGAELYEASKLNKAADKSADMVHKWILKNQADSHKYNAKVAPIVFGSGAAGLYAYDRWKRKQLGIND